MRNNLEEEAMAQILCLGRESSEGESKQIMCILVTGISLRV